MDDFAISRKLSNMDLSDDEEIDQASAFKNKSLPRMDGNEDDLGRNISEPREGEPPLDGAGSQIYSDISSGSKIRLDIDESTQSLNPICQSDSVSDVLGRRRTKYLDTKAAIPMSLSSYKQSASDELQRFTSVSKKASSLGSAPSPTVTRTKHDHDDHGEGEEQEEEDCCRFPMPKSQFDNFPQSPPATFRSRKERDGGKSPSFSYLTLSHIGKNTVTYSPFRYSPRSSRTRERFHSQESLAGEAPFHASEGLILHRQSGRPSLPRVPRSSPESIEVVEMFKSDQPAPSQTYAPSVLFGDQDNRPREGSAASAQNSRGPANLAMNRTESIASSASPFRSVRLEDKEDVLEWFGIRHTRTFDCSGSPSKAKTTLTPLWETDKEDEKEE